MESGLSEKAMLELRMSLFKIQPKSLLSPVNITLAIVAGLYQGPPRTGCMLPIQSSTAAVANAQVRKRGVAISLALQSMHSGHQ